MSNKERIEKLEAEMTAVFEQLDKAKKMLPEQIPVPPRFQSPHCGPEA